MTQKSLAMRARTRYTTPDEFITAHGRYFDHQGVYVRTQQKKPPGTPVRFEFQLADGQIVFRGEGIVTQPTANLFEGESLYLKLTRLDRQSKVLFHRIRDQLGLSAPSSSGYPTSLDEIGDLSHPPGPPPAPPVEPSQTVSASSESPTPSPDRQPPEGGLTSADLEMIADAIENSLDSVLLSSLSEGTQPAWPQDFAEVDTHPGTQPPPAPVERHPVAPAQTESPLPDEQVARASIEPDEENISDDFEIVVSPEVEVEQEVIVDLAPRPPLPSEPEEIVVPEQPEVVEDVTEMAKIAESLRKQWETDIAQLPQEELPAEVLEEELPAEALEEELPAEVLEEELPAEVLEEELPVLQPLRFVEEEEEKPVISDLIADLITEKKAVPSPRKAPPVQKPATDEQPSSAAEKKALLDLETGAEQMAAMQEETPLPGQPPAPSPARSKGFFKRLFGRK